MLQEAKLVVVVVVVGWAALVVVYRPPWVPSLLWKLSIFNSYSLVVIQKLASVISKKLVRGMSASPKNIYISNIHYRSSGTVYSGEDKKTKKEVCLTSTSTMNTMLTN